MKEKISIFILLIAFTFFLYAMSLIVIWVYDMRQCKSMGYNIYNFYEKKCIKINSDWKIEKEVYLNFNI